MIAAAVARLKTIREARIVEGAAGLAAVGSVSAAPALHVLPLGETARPGAYITDVVQATTMEIGVHIVLRGADIDALETWRDRSIAALVGWTPDPTTGAAVEYAGFMLVDFAPAEGRWLFRFRVDRRITRQRGE